MFSRESGVRAKEYSGVSHAAEETSIKPFLLVTNTEVFQLQLWSSLCPSAFVFWLMIL